MREQEGQQEGGVPCSPPRVPAGRERCDGVPVEARLAPAGVAGSLDSSALLGTAAGRFVDQAYQDLLNRHAEPGGLAYWGDLLGQVLIQSFALHAGCLRPLPRSPGILSVLAST